MLGRRKSNRRRVTSLVRLLRRQDGLVVLVVIVLVLYLMGGENLLSQFGFGGAWRDDREAVLAQVKVIAGKPEVTDGDSLRIHDERIRILGIDAPELGQDCFDETGGAVKCGILSRQHMSHLIDGRSVSCRWLERDKYHRVLGHCHVAKSDGTLLDLNRAMVEDGWAFSYSSYPQEEKQARANKRGMWVWKVQKPQNWRRAHLHQ